MRHLVLATTLLVVGSMTASAQFSERVQSGVRVRVWLPESHLQENGPWRRQWLRATVNEVVGDTLRLDVRGIPGSLAVPRSNILRIDVSRGSSRVASAFERAIGGAFVGAINAAVWNDPGGTEWPNFKRDWRAAEEGAKWGAVFGAVVGFVFPTERWRRVRTR